MCPPLARAIRPRPSRAVSPQGAGQGTGSLTAIVHRLPTVAPACARPAAGVTAIATSSARVRPRRPLPPSVSSIPV
eukprot:1994296-Pleurochrysis_carterae.AAC.1